MKANDLRIGNYLSINTEYMKKVFDEKFEIEYGNNFKTEVSLNDYIAFRIRDIKKKRN